MEIHHYSCIKILTFSLPLICLLLSRSWGVAATTATLPPPSSALLAADALRTRGYSLFASVLLSLSTTTYNFSGTILAPPDFAFSFAAAKFLNNHRPPPRPTISLLLYHTIKPPRILKWSELSSLNDGDELLTLYYNNCLFLSRNFGGDISVSATPFVNQISAVKIRQPDLYVDQHLTVHGIDSVLDPTFATRCSFPYADSTSTVDFAPPKVNRTFLDHAMRALRRTGYSVVAAAMGIRRSELLSLSSVTIFAVSDSNFFLKPGGFRYDFRHHVVPVRRRFADLARLTVGGAEFETLAPNKTVTVDSVDGAVTVDGVAVDRTEVYHNRWIVVVSVVMSLDDVVRPQANPPVSDSSAPFPAVYASDNLTEVLSPSPATGGDLTDLSSIGAPSPSDELDYAPEISPDDFLINGSISPAPESAAGENSGPSPSPAPVTDGVSDAQCDMNGVVSVGVEGGDLFCPVNKRRELREDEKLTSVNLDVSQPSDAEKVQIVEKVNIADDLFFYF